VILTGQDLRETAEGALDPAPDADDFGPTSVDVHPAAAEDRIVESGEHWVVASREDIAVPLDVAALITGRSGHMRDGLFMPAGWLDPGFESDRAGGRPLKLEFGNTSDGAAVVRAGEPAARLTFFQLSGETDGYRGRWP
jgi:deoxycytidine triphosphate deaminase